MNCATNAEPFASRRQCFGRALFDNTHLHHNAAQQRGALLLPDWWFKIFESEGWATCALTLNGCLRILSHPRMFTPPQTAPEIARLMRQAMLSPNHRFLPDNLLITDDTSFDLQKVAGPNQITDVYLLGLAVAHGGRFVTFDGKIPRTAVRGAKQEDLLVIT